MDLPFTWKQVYEIAIPTFLSMWWIWGLPLLFAVMVAVYRFVTLRHHRLR